MLLGVIAEICEVSLRSEEAIKREERNIDTEEEVTTVTGASCKSERELKSIPV